MAVGDLTTLANVKAWRTPVIASSADDTQITREITAASKAILQTLQRRSVAYMTYVETRNGQGTSGIMLKNFPIVAVTSVIVDGITIKPPNPMGGNGYGYVFSTEDMLPMLYLRGFCFTFGAQNVTIGYSAGLLAVDPDLAIPTASPNKIACSDLAELWCTNGSVTYSGTTTTLTPVRTAPAVGQYVVPTGPDGFYLFNSAEPAGFVDIAYGYTPKDIEEACIDTVILEYNRRSRIGENSKVLAAENINYYSSAAFTKTIESRLQSYMNVVPNV